jgi:two-component system, NarL family, sensor kinase
VVTAMDMTDEVALRERLRLAEEHVRRLSVHQLALHEQQIAGLSRELHDDLGQVLSLLKLHLGSAARAERGSERQSLEVMEALPLVDLAINRLREVCSDLRPSELSDFGLGPALAALCAAAARAGGIQVTMQEGGVARALDSTLELGLFRVAQQSLTNALRHAGAAHVGIELLWLEGGVELRVADDGAGFDDGGPLQPHQHGLRGMRERMDLLGGSLSVESRLGVGTTVCARIPR